jgi:carbamoyl-phosphate synthase large subunit
MAAGLSLAHFGGVIPRCDEPEFASAVADLARGTGAAALVSTIAEEVDPLTAGLELLTEAGLTTWLPSPETVRMCVDKWLFAQRMVEAGVRTPATALGQVGGVPGPWVIKPRWGRGSRDVYVAASELEAEWAIARVPDPIVQTQLAGREFTVDTLNDKQGHLLAAVPRWRLETKGGISTKGMTFGSRDVRNTVADVLSAVSMAGPANVQGFVDMDGDVSIVEVNPRFSGGLPLSLAAGANLVHEYLRGLVGLPMRPHELRAREGVRMTRYFSEVFDCVDDMHKVGWPSAERPLPSIAIWQGVAAPTVTE